MKSQPPRPFRWTEAAILVVFVALAAIVTARHDREVRQVFAWVEWVGADGRRPDWVRGLRGPTLRLVAAFRAFLSVATLGGGLATLRRPRVMRGRRWPSLG